ncbi:MAG: apolipoprotein N-acyltransferase [Longimicrobiales bacterium]
MVSALGAWWVPRSGERLLPVVSALLLVACAPPLHPVALPFVALVPLALFVAGRSPDAHGRAAAVRGGLLFGAVYFGLLVHWVLALVGYSAWAVPAWIGAVLLLSSVGGLVTWVAHRGLHGTRAPVWLVVPVAWTAGEWFRAHWPGPLAFPWMELGVSLTAVPEMVGVAEVVGTRGVGFWIAAVNGLLAQAVLDAPRRIRWSAVAALVLIVPAAWGVWRAGTLEVRPAVRVAVVQPGIPQETRLRPAAATAATFASLDRLLPSVPPGSVDLVVLPEAVVSAYPELPGGRGALRRLIGYARTAGAPVLFGAFGASEAGPGTKVHNSAFVVDSSGLRPFRYDKQYLVPAVEAGGLVPGAPWLPGGLRGGFTPGRESSLVDVGGVRFAPMICYESAHARAAVDARRGGADVLVNLTNDAWFGGQAFRSRSGALWQHPAHAVMRAIETRAGLVRAANTGRTMIVDPTGRVAASLPRFEPGVLVGEVSTTDVRTAFVRWGDLAGNGAAAAASLLVAVSALGARRRERGTSGPGSEGPVRPSTPSLDPTDSRS